jgi:hypothetical protein
MVTTTSILGVTAPTIVVDSRHLAGQGRTLALTRPHRGPGGALVHSSDCLGSLLVVMRIVA